MGKVLLVSGATIVAAMVLWLGVDRLEPDSAALAFLLVWVPMAWMGTVSRVVPPRLPRRWYVLHDWERDGRLYERLGVRVVKRLLRRGPMAVFNPGLHLPPERSPEQLAKLEGRMEVAEASHVIVFVAVLAAIAGAAARGWWLAAGSMVLLDVLMNGYPVLLQRYNRALLHHRYPALRHDR